MQQDLTHNDRLLPVPQNKDSGLKVSWGKFRDEISLPATILLWHDIRPAAEEQIYFCHHVIVSMGDTFTLTCAVQSRPNYFDRRHISKVLQIFKGSAIFDALHWRVRYFQTKVTIIQAIAFSAVRVAMRSSQMTLGWLVHFIMYHVPFDVSQLTEVLGYQPKLDDAD